MELTTYSIIEFFIWIFLALVIIGATSYTYNGKEDKRHSKEEKNELGKLADCNSDISNTYILEYANDYGVKLINTILNTPTSI